MANITVKDSAIQTPVSINELKFSKNNPFSQSCDLNKDSIVVNDPYKSNINTNEHPCSNDSGILDNGSSQYVDNNPFNVDISNTNDQFSESNFSYCSQPGTHSVFNNEQFCKIKFSNSSIFDSDKDTIAINLTHDGEDKIFGIDIEKNYKILNGNKFASFIMSKFKNLPIFSIYDRNFSKQSVSVSKFKYLLNIIKQYLLSNEKSKIAFNQQNFMKYKFDVMRLIDQCFYENGWNITVHATNECPQPSFLLSNINVKEKRDKPFVSCKIEDKESFCMLDSGADISIIESEFFESLNLPISSINHYIDVRGVSGDSIEILGSSVVTLNFKKQHIPVHVYITKNANIEAPILLGTNFLSENNITIDYGKRSIKCNEKPLVWVSPDAEICVSSEESINVAIKNQLELPPFSRTIFMHKLDNVPNANYYTINNVNPKLGNMNCKLMLSDVPGIFNLDNNKIPVELENKSNKKRILDPGFVICSVSLIHSSPTLRRGKKISTIIECTDEEILKPNSDSKSSFNVKDHIDKVLQDIEDEPHNLKDVLYNNTKVFASSELDIGVVKDYVHKIELTDDVPVTSKPYRTPHSKTVEMDNEVKRLLKAGIINYSNSSYASPCLVVYKKSRKPRLVVDYRKLNKKVRPIQYPIPHLENSLQLLGGNQYFSSLDLLAGYHQIPLDKNDQHKTAFTTGRGLYEYCRVPFGLNTSGAAMQNTMEKVLNGLNGVICIVYIDDVIITGKNIENHDKNLNTVLQRLAEHGFKINIQKCKFRQTSIECLGHIISEAGIQPHPDRVQSLQNKRVPRCVKDVKSFCGLASYYRRFVNNFARIAAPLTHLTKKNTPWSWSDECQLAYETLIKAISSAPILAYPDFKKTFYVTSDASTEGIGAELSQIHNGIHKPIAFYSRSLNSHEKKYPIYQLEGLAIKAALQKFRFYILGYSIVVRTDNKPILHLLKSNQCEGTVGKYLAAILEFSPTFEYIPGKENFCADFLSRNVSLVSKSVTILPDEIDSVEKLILSQKTDHFIASMSNNPKYINKIVKINDLLYFQDSNEKRKLIIPKTLQNIYINYFHAKLGCHEGMTRSISRINKYIFWPTINRDVKNFINNCKVCKMSKPSHLQQQQLGTFPECNDIFERLHVDLLGPLPKSIGNKKYIFVGIDAYSHWCILKSITKKESHIIIDIVRDDIINKFKCPTQIVCDMGSEFVSNAFKDFCSENNIDLHVTAPYHHASNGQVERLNLQIENSLRSMLCEHKGSWPDYVPIIMNSLNSTVHGSIGVTPFELVYNCNAPVELPGILKPENFLDHEIVELKKIVKGKIDKCKSKKQKNNRYKRKRQFKYDDQVYVKDPKPKNKLNPIYKGPYRVIKVHDSGYSYDLKNDKTDVIIRSHINNIK